MDGLALYGDSDHEESGDSSISEKPTSKEEASDLSMEKHEKHQADVEEMAQNPDTQPAVGSTVNDNSFEGSPRNSLCQITSEPTTTDFCPDSSRDSSNKQDTTKSSSKDNVITQQQTDSSMTAKTSSKSPSSTEDSSCKKHAAPERRPSASRDSSEKKHGGRRSEDRRDTSGRRDRRRSRSKEKASCGSSRSRGGGGGSKSAPQRHRSRSRERSRRARSKSKDRRRSRSRSHPRAAARGARSRSRERRRSRSREKTSKRSNSRDRHPKKRAHSRSRSKERHTSRKSPPPPAPSSKTEDKSNVPPSDSNTTVITVRFPSGISHIVVDKQPLEAVTETPSNLPLHDAALGPRPGSVTPQMAVQQAMAAMNARTQMMTGVALPKYYNPSAVNPMKYAEQIQKRKLLWQSNKEKKEETLPSSNQWESTMFPQDQDGKMAAKFKKLMGIKNSESVASTSAVPPQSEEQIKKQEELFRTLDQQYEVARISTHTHRGVGLGFSSALQTQYLIPK